MIKLTASEVVALKKGDIEAYAVLYEKYHRLYLFVLDVFVRDMEKAQKLLSALLQKIYEQIPQLVEADYFTAWSLRIARQLAREELMNDPRFQGLTLEEAEDTLRLERDPFIVSEYFDDLQNVTTVLVWCFDLPVSMVATLLGRKTSSVHLALKTAEKALLKHQVVETRSFIKQRFDEDFITNITLKEAMENVQITVREYNDKFRLPGTLKAMFIMIAIVALVATGVSIYENINDRKREDNPYGFKATSYVHVAERDTRSSGLEPSLALKSALQAFSAKMSDYYSLEEEFLVSPTTYFLNLMALAGTSEGDIQEDFLTFLGLESNFDLALEAQNYLAYMNYDYVRERETEYPQKTSRLRFQSSLWLDQQQSYTSIPLQNFAQTYASDVFVSDFNNGQGDLTKWIRYQTSLSESDIPTRELTSSALLYQTIFLRDAWTIPFTDTEGGFFTQKDGSSLAATYLTRTGTFTLFDHSAFTIVVLPLEEGTPVAFWLPKEGHSLNEITSTLIEQYLQGSLTKSEEILSLSIPRFAYRDDHDFTFIPSVNDLPFAGAMSQCLTGDEVVVEASWQDLTFSIDQNGVFGAHQGKQSEDIDITEISHDPITFDRPFFYLVGDGLYMGTVYQPKTT